MLAPLRAIAFVTAWIAAGSVAIAQPAPGDDGDPLADERAAQTTNRINLRVGAASTDTVGRPTICLEVTAVAALSFEACGTGAGILHGEPGVEMAHFRGKWQVARRTLYGGQLRLQLGVGLAELQLGDDDPGFQLSPRGRRIEAAGPESSVTAQWLRPISDRWELFATGTAGMAWIPGAGELATPRAQAQPFVGFDLGVGW